MSAFFQASVLKGARVGASVAAIQAAVLPVRSVQGLRGGHHDDEASYNEGPLQRTLAIIKPDAVAAGNEDNIKQAILDHGFKIVAEKKIQLTKKQVCSEVPLNLLRLKTTVSLSGHLASTTLIFQERRSVGIDSAMANRVILSYFAVFFGM
jgi:hypothetical protein